MSIDKIICEKIISRWGEFGNSVPTPKSLVFLKVQSKNSNNGSVVALILDDATRQAVAVVKIPRNPEIQIAIDQEMKAMEYLSEHYKKWSGASAIPCQGFIETIPGGKVLIQRAVSGSALVREFIYKDNIKSLINRVMPWLLEFHKYKNEAVTLNNDHITSLILKPVVNFKLLMKESGIKLNASVEKYLDILPEKIQGQSLRLVPKHGDFNAHNIISADANHPNFGFIVIDWEDFRPSQLPIHDINHFFVSSSKLMEMTLSAQQAFDKYIIKNGWYQNLYVNFVEKYQSNKIINSDLFWTLTPMYFVESSLQMQNEHRQQEETLRIWMYRLTQFIEKFQLIKK